MTLAATSEGIVLASDGMAAICLHCGGPVRGGGRFCCRGCAGAHALIARLGLVDWYQRRPAEIAAPAVDLVPTDPAPFVRIAGDTASLDLAVDGLHCAACVWLIETALGYDRDVIEARLNATTGRLHLRWRGPASRATGFADLVRGLGYRVAPFVPGAALSLAGEEERFLLRCLAVAAFAATNVMLLSVAVWSGGDSMGTATRDLLHWISAVIALPALLFAGRPFLRSAIGALRHGRATMDLPIVIGVTLTAGVSLSETIRSGPHAYFESALMLVFFLLVGRYVERRARGRSRSAAAHLLSLASGVATVEEPNGELRTVAAGGIMRGDILRLATGERALADAVLLDSSTRIDNAVVTGESAPAAVSMGDTVPCGAINLGPSVRLRVEAAGNETTLARIAVLLEGAEQGRGRFTAIADRIARWYTPAVHMLAGAAFGIWVWGVGLSVHDGLLIAAAILIVTCPCALALAQPAANAAAVTALARCGVLVVSPTALERLASIDVVVFDKTGTLTVGRPTLLYERTLAPADLALAASLAANSRHPLARALVQASPDVVPAHNVVEHPGQGLMAGDVRLGSRAFCSITGRTAGDAGSEMWLTRPGHEPVRFAFADALRPDAGQTVEALKRRGLEVHLLSGDRAPAVAAVAADLGIDAWEAELTPELKLQRIEAMTAAGRRPLMIGDGINDAPVLAAAHASLSPGGATDIATAAADAVIQGEKLRAVIDALDLAQSATRTTRVNLILALAYNLVAVPVAVLGFLTPPIAAAAMSGSSLLVILNALRVGKYRPIL